MKAKVLIFSIILSLNFANNCEAQILGDIVNTAMRKKAEKKKQKKQKEQKEQKEQTNTDEIHMLLERSEFNEDMDVLMPDMDVLMPDMSEDNGKQVTIKKEDNKQNVNVKSNDDVALTVSADGATKEEATKIALRSAIEQAYGTFVSANTTILNDDIVKDEIVTISNGNIKSYQEIASAILPNGRTTVTLNAVVSISKLTSFAKSKGASTEFAGATFAMNVKMRELNKKNEMKALDNLIIQIKNLLPVALERELVLSEPELYSDRSTMSGYFYNHKQMNPNNYYILKIRINYKKSENTFALGNLIYSTLKALEPTEEEYNYFKTDAYAEYSLRRFKKYSWGHLDRIRTRLSQEEFENYDSKMKKVLIDYLTDFEILDNTGTKSSFNVKRWGEYIAESNRLLSAREEYKIEERAKAEKMSENTYHGTGIFSPVVAVQDHYSSKFKDFFKDIYRHYGELRGYDDGFQWDFCVIIPKANIAKYTQFTIQPKTK